MIAVAFVFTMLGMSAAIAYGVITGDGDAAAAAAFGGVFVGGALIAANSEFE